MLPALPYIPWAGIIIFISNQETKDKFMGAFAIII
jgi:hypothetical protein